MKGVISVGIPQTHPVDKGLDTAIWWMISKAGNASLIHHRKPSQRYHKTPERKSACWAKNETNVGKWLPFFMLVPFVPCRDVLFRSLLVISTSLWISLGFEGHLPAASIRTW